jgi:putative nucleotidyltransferase with HDIG domain
MSREEALALLKKYLHKENLVLHCIASEAVMRGVARHLGANEDEWGIAGLLHDIDFELTEDEPERHGLVAMNLLPAEIPADIRDAVLRHNEANGSVRERPIDFALSAGESLTGLIIATALVYPDKKVSSVKVKSVTKRMKEKAFARNVSRECILECEKIGMDLDKFVEIGIRSMETVAGELGL